MIQPGIYSFIGGFHDKPNTGGSRDNPTGYIAPVRKEILDHNIVYEYRYQLVLGTLNEIRAVAKASRVADTRPDYRFTHDRQHWIYTGVADTGFPIKGNLHLVQGPRDPQMIGPEQWWRADDVPRLYIRAAFRTHGDHAEIFWSVPDKGFSNQRRLAFSIKPDGEFHTYEVNLALGADFTAERSTVCGSTRQTRSAREKKSKSRSCHGNQTEITPGAGHSRRFSRSIAHIRSGELILISNPSMIGPVSPTVRLGPMTGTPRCSGQERLITWSKSFRRYCSQV